MLFKKRSAKPEKLVPMAKVITSVKDFVNVGERGRPRPHLRRSAGGDTRAFSQSLEASPTTAADAKLGSFTHY